MAVKVGGLGAGKVTVSGRGIKKTTKTITKSTVATITAKRTKGKPGKVTVTFDPAGPGEGAQDHQVAARRASGRRPHGRRPLCLLRCVCRTSVSGSDPATEVWRAMW